MMRSSGFCGGVFAFHRTGDIRRDVYAVLHLILSGLCSLLQIMALMTILCYAGMLDYFGPTGPELRAIFAGLAYTLTPIGLLVLVTGIHTVFIPVLGSNEISDNEYWAAREYAQLGWGFMPFEHSYTLVAPDGTSDTIYGWSLVQRHLEELKGNASVKTAILPSA